jgi:hypothetical protein
VGDIPLFLGLEKRDSRALAGVVPAFVVLGRRAAAQTVEGRLCRPSGEMMTVGWRAERVYR